MKRVIGLLLALALSTASISAQAGTASKKNLPAVNDHGWVTRGGASVLLIETISTVSGSIGEALTQLGVPYDFFVGEDFSALNLAAYQHVIVGMDGGLIEDPSILNARNYVAAGGFLHFYGGTCYDPYALALNTHLLQNNIFDFCWTTVLGAPDITITDASNYLAAGLPATYDFLDESASFYQTRSTDGATNVAAANGDGYDALMWKSIGSGRFDICINSPYDGYYSNQTDFNWLKQVILNMLQLNTTAVEPATWGAVKANFQ